MNRGSNTSYKANVNRTKTRKWVEAKVQNYDGDDWGNDYDDEYDDGNDEPYEPEPMPSKPTKPTGLRQPGQTGHQLPSSRTFSQPSTNSPWSDPDARAALGPSSLRNPSGPPSLHLQTKATAAGVTPQQPYTIESAYPATTSSHTNVPSGSYSAGPASTPARFPPRKSSMGQQDRPNIDNKQASKSDSGPGSSSGNQPWVEQRSASPGQGPAKTTPFVRPADIYKRVGDEKEKERLSMESGRPSLDSIQGQNDSQFRSPGEQRRRTSLESQDGSDPTRTRKSNLAPVAERKSEYGMDGLLAKAQADQASTSQESAMLNPRLSISQAEPNDEIKADLMKSRRFSTSPQLPTLSRMSGFGDDFFPSSGNSSSWVSPSLLASRNKQSLRLDEDRITAAPIGGNQQEQPRGIRGSPGADPTTTTFQKPKDNTEGTIETHQSRPVDTRPQLPGGWVTECSTVAISSDGVTPTAQQQHAHGPTLPSGVENTHTDSMTKNDEKLDDISQATEAPTVSASSTHLEGTPDNTPASGFRAQESDGDTRRHGNGMIPEASAPNLSDTNTQPLPFLETANLSGDSRSRPTPTMAHGDERNTPLNDFLSADQPTTGHSTGTEFSPTAPLNPNRPQADQPDLILPSPHERQSTIDTVDTASPEKESDKLREEIIKSLSPAPISPGSDESLSRGNSDAAPPQDDLTRESRYLSGVYDDYLSLAEEKSLQELSQATKLSTHMTLNHSSTEANASTSDPQDLSSSQPAPLSPVKTSLPENTNRGRRFSWQQDNEEMTPSPAELKLPAPGISPGPPAESPKDTADVPTSNGNGGSPVADTLSAEPGAASTISHQVSQVSSLTPDASLAPIESPSPLSFAATRRPNPIADVSSAVRLSLADEKEKVLIGDVQSRSSSTSEQHPALQQALEQGHDTLAVAAATGANPAQTSAPTPTGFREILNLPSYEERVQKFEETREQFYVMESGLSDWLAHLQSQLEHSDAITVSDPKSLLSKTGTQPAASAGASGTSPLSHKGGPTASHTRRMSIGGMQQLMAGQGGGFGGSGNQVGTKSKELLHAAGAFGNKGMKSGMKLFNKGKNKLRERAAERAAGDKARF